MFTDLYYLKWKTMNRITQNAAKKIWNELSINWDEVSLDNFMKGLNVDPENGISDNKINVTETDGRLGDELAWAHLEDLRDYYTRNDKM